MAKDVSADARCRSMPGPSLCAGITCKWYWLTPGGLIQAKVGPNVSRVAPSAGLVRVRPAGADGVGVGAGAGLGNGVGVGAAGASTTIAPSYGGVDVTDIVERARCIEGETEGLALGQYTGIEAAWPVTGSSVRRGVFVPPSHGGSNRDCESCRRECELFNVNVESRCCQSGRVARSDRNTP